MKKLLSQLGIIGTFTGKVSVERSKPERILEKQAGGGNKKPTLQAAGTPAKQFSSRLNCQKQY